MNINIYIKLIKFLFLYFNLQKLIIFNKKFDY